MSSDRQYEKRDLKQQFKKERFTFEKAFVFPYEVDCFITTITWRLKIVRRKLCHCCCGESQIGGLRIDMKHEVKPDLVARVQDLPNILGENSQDNILIDPPWAISYQSRREFSYAVRDILKVGGYLIFNAPWCPWVTGLSDISDSNTEVWKVVQNFNSYRDLVDFWIFKKLPT